MNNRNTKYNYGLISKYRALLMGVAILLIMFCHLDVAQSYHGIERTRLASVLQTGSVGVDIFLFLSGIGLYYSYTENRLSYWEFEKKRLIRILPYYFLFGGITYFLYDIIINHDTISKFLSDLFFVTWFKTGSTKYWYVLAIVAFYLLFPALYSFIHKDSHAFLKVALFSIVWFIVIELLCHFNEDIGKFRIALERLPIFMLGIYCGKLSFEKRPIHVTTIIIYIFLGFILLALQKRVLPRPWNSYLHYPIRGTLAISIMTTIIVVMELLENSCYSIFYAINKVLSWFGGSTYELYLFHQSYMLLFDSPYKLIVYFIVAFLLPTITAIALHCIRKAVLIGINSQKEH